MTKRLVRAKAKIKATGLRFEEPESNDLPLRLDAVLEAIYGAYMLDWNHDAPPTAEPLAAEALYLAHVVATLLPAEPEALGLLALLEADAARAPARLDANGRLVPLQEQDTAAWDGARLDRAAALLTAAQRLHRPGPYQLEAAIQLAHASRRHGCATPWTDIAALYDGLLALRPSIGAQIGHALATAYAGGDPGPGLALLQAVDPARGAVHQGWWAAHAHLLERAGHVPEALAAYEQALALTNAAALRATLAQRQRALAGRLH